ncbi:prepilin-type N-terminal cleavage/methylation domain-containing protein [bacterium]|nr:prepilin-type N-terminal cleavage/methylation domain-containing protein [bacterium]
MPKTVKGFTLIELLIVVAIVAILAAIAVPNFLEAQVRSKVSRTKADMRSVATAVESYYVDQNRYPVANIAPVFTLPGGGNPGAANACDRSGAGLTTPVAYMTAIPVDPFGVTAADDDFTFGGTAEVADGYYYASRAWAQCRGLTWKVYPNGSGSTATWVLQSKGPDRYFSRSAKTGIPATDEVDEPFKWQYDPTNGTVSAGNIVRSGP